MGKMNSYKINKGKLSLYQRRRNIPRGQIYWERGYVTYTSGQREKGDWNNILQNQDLENSRSLAKKRLEPWIWLWDLYKNTALSSPASSILYKAPAIDKLKTTTIQSKGLGKYNYGFSSWWSVEHRREWQWFGSTTDNCGQLFCQISCVWKIS